MRPCVASEVVLHETSPVCVYVHLCVCACAVMSMFYNPPYHVLKASLIAQLVKKLPVMQETPIRFLDQEAPLEKA